MRQGFGEDALKSFVIAVFMEHRSASTAAIEDTVHIGAQCCPQWSAHTPQLIPRRLFGNRVLPPFLAHGERSWQERKVRNFLDAP
jgi:hypothetical protein